MKFNFDLYRQGVTRLAAWICRFLFIYFISSICNIFQDKYLILEDFWRDGPKGEKWFIVYFSVFWLTTLFTHLPAAVGPPHPDSEAIPGGVHLGGWPGIVGRLVQGRPLPHLLHRITHGRHYYYNDRAHNNSFVILVWGTRAGALRPDSTHWLEGARTGPHLT